MPRVCIAVCFDNFVFHSPPCCPGPPRPGPNPRPRPRPRPKAPNCLLPATKKFCQVDVQKSKRFDDRFLLLLLHCVLTGSSLLCSLRGFNASVNLLCKVQGLGLQVPGVGKVSSGAGGVFRLVGRPFCLDSCHDEVGGSVGPVWRASVWWAASPVAASWGSTAHGTATRGAWRSAVFHGLLDCLVEDHVEQALHELLVHAPAASEKQVPVFSKVQ